MYIAKAALFLGIGLLGHRWNSGTHPCQLDVPAAPPSFPLPSCTEVQQVAAAFLHASQLTNHSIGGFSHIFRGEHTVFKDDHYPDYIFKIGKASKKASTYQRTHLHDLIHRNDLSLLIIPAAQDCPLQGSSPDEQKYTTARIEQFLPIVGGFDDTSQKEMYRLGDKQLHEAVKQFTRFLIRVDGMSDISFRNVIALNQTDKDGNWKLGLVDIDSVGRGGIKESLIGRPLLGSLMQRSWLQCLTDSQIDIAIETAAEELGTIRWNWLKLTSPFDKVVEQRRNQNYNENNPFIR